MKLAPVARAFEARSDVRHVVIHTGQHYDRGMSDTFFEQLAIPEPDFNLGVGSGTHAQQTAAIMQRLEPVFEQERPDTLLVYGDVNSTVAAALVASKLGIRVGHVEAGLRSRDWSMPEEINRVLTDRLSDLLFVPSPDGRENLLAEGVPEDRIHFVGNVMIDTLVWALPKAQALDATARHQLPAGEYVLVTLHRPSNVDDPDRLGDLLGALATLGRERPIFFPVHPRTRQRIDALGWKAPAGTDLRFVEPVPYLEMLGLTEGARLMVTDSGGVQEETSYLGVPCITVRPNTERPITCTEGTNRLVEPTAAALLEVAERALDEAEGKRRALIARWDGKAGERIFKVLVGEESYLD
jgi:UDP-N-acetylglucosamine 2-epimerase (non-hydrolysing)